MTNAKEQLQQFLRSYYKSLPVGYAFRPTDVELSYHYLRLKNAQMLRPYDEFFIASLELDVYSCNPWDLAVAGKSLFQSGDSMWYFFSPKKYIFSIEQRCRATEQGVWVLTQMVRDITGPPRSSVIGKKRTLIFYPRGVERDTSVVWAIHEYSTTTDQDDYVLCRLLKKPAEMILRREDTNKPAMLSLP